MVGAAAQRRSRLSMCAPCEVIYGGDIRRGRRAAEPERCVMVPQRVRDSDARDIARREPLWESGTCTCIVHAPVCAAAPLAR